MSNNSMRAVHIVGLVLGLVVVVVVLPSFIIGYKWLLFLFAVDLVAFVIFCIGLAVKCHLDNKGGH